MNHISTLTRSRWLLLTLFTLLVGVSPAWGDAYTTGFEKGVDGWNCESSPYTLTSVGTGWTLQGEISCFRLNGEYKSGYKSLYYYNSDGANSSDYLITPKLSAGTITFYVKKPSNASSPRVYVYKCSKNGNGFTVHTDQAKYINLSGSDVPSNSWAECSFELAQDEYVAIYLNRVYMDDFSSSAGLAYVPPVPATLEASSITAETATISWTAGSGDDSEIGWDFEYKEASSDNWVEQHNIEKTTTTINLSALTQNTTYDIRVRALFAGSVVSDWKTGTFKTAKVATPATGFLDNFETDKGWEFINGTLTNKWVRGTATNNGGSNALYISNDGGTTNAYTNSSAAMVYATKLFAFEAGDYTISYDWKANGESTYDYLRVALVPANVELTAGTTTPTGFSASGLPTGWTALDSGSKLNLQSSWQSKSVEISIAETGNYQIVFAWRDDTSTGTNPPAAIDNFKIIGAAPVIELGGDVVGNALAFGSVAETTNRTITITNSGKVAMENITLTETADEDNVFAYAALPKNTLAVDESMDVQVTFSGSSAKDYTGTFRVAANDCDAVDVTVTATYSNSPATMAVTLGVDEVGASVAFGSVGKQVQKTFTVTNGGDQTLNITSIVSNNTTDFTVSPAALTVAGHSSEEFTVTFVYPNENPVLDAEMTATITVTASNDGVVAKSFTVTGTRIEQWSEDFTGNTLPDGWENENDSYWTFTNGVAKGSYAYSSNYGLITPLLIVEEGASLSFQARATSTYESLVITMSKNGGDWESCKTISYSELPTTMTTFTIDGLDAGNYKFRFKNGSFELDNFEGFKRNMNDPKMGIYTNSQCTAAAAATVTRNYGFVTEAPEAVVYYMKNDGTGTLNLTLGDVPTGFTAVLGKTSLAADESTTLTINMPIATKGYRGGDIVVTGKDSGDNTLGTFTVTASGVVEEEGKMNLNFATDDIPAGWTTNDWERNTTNGYVEIGYKSTPNTLQTTKLVASAGETLVVVAKQTYSSSSYTFGVKIKDADDVNADWEDLISAENIGTDYVMLHGTIANAGNYLVQFNGIYTQIQRIYGLAMPLEPVMIVYDGENVAGANKNFGMVSDEADAVWTLTVKNEGQAKLEGLAAALSGEQAAHYSAVITGATGAGNDEIEAGDQATITVKQLKDNLGDHEATLTISATGLDSKVIALSGSTRDHTLLYVDFDGSNDWPAAVASHGANWEVYAGYARQTSTTASSLVLAPLTISQVSDALRFKASRVDTNRDLKVRYTTNGGVTWNDYNFGTNETPVISLKEQITSSFSDFVITNIPAGTVAFDFYGQSVKLDNINADYSLATAPLVAFTKVTDNISDANLTADAEATYTLANIGNANYVGTVAKANVNVDISGDGVTYEASTLTIPAGKTAEITVTMPFAAPYGAKNGSMTITSESWVGDVAVNYTANLIDPDAINVDFASAPAGWYNADWTVDGSAHIYSGVEKEMISEQFAAEEGKNVLSFKAKAQSGNEGTLKVYTSTDRKTWSEPTEFVLTNEYATKSLAALADGNYYVKFVSLNANIDDLTGLKKIAAVPEHDLYVSTSNIPTATKVPETSITATATVYSLRANEEGVYAKLFFDNVEVAAADAQDISLNDSKTFELTGNVSAVEKTYAAKIVVYYGDNSVAFETLTTNVEVQHTRTLAITSFTRDGEGDLSADVDNKITAQFNVTVQNNSTCDLTADEVKVSIVNAAGEVYQMNDADNVTAATAVLAKDASVVIPVTLTISAGEGGDFKFRAKELVSNTATLEANDITIHVNAQAPQFALNIKGGAALADGDNVAFGLVKEATTKQYTISNTGTKALVLTSIVAPAGYSVTEINDVNKTIAANETLDIDVTLLAEQGKKAGNLVFTYGVNGTPTTFTLALTGRSEAANVWEEYFATEIPASWQKTGWTWNADRQTAYSGGVQGEFTLMTPRLSAAAGQVLTYETKWQYDGDDMTVQYSTDKTSWTDYETVTASTETVEHQFVAPAAGNYYLKFTANRYVDLDNFIGFALNIPEHDMELAASSVPTTGKRLNSYVATVTLRENAGKNENITAELWVAGAKVNATADVTSVEANSNATVVTLTWEPQTTLNAVNAYVKVTYAGGTLETTPVTLTIAEVYTLSENSSDDVEAVNNETVMLQRTFAAGWNTICLPFAVADNTAIKALFGAGAKVFNFKNFANNMIEFEAVTSMTAATPYLIYVPAAITEPIRVNNVTITGVNTTAGTAWKNNITFQGSYAPVAAGGLTDMYGVTTANKLAKGNANTTMKGFRAYFEGTLAGARIYTFDDATGISHVYQAAEVFGDDDRVYNMNGQHVENAKKGVYIVNGRKVVIK